MSNDLTEKEVRVRTNAAILGTALEIQVRAMDHIAGNAISTSLDGTFMTLVQRANLSLASIRNSINRQLATQGARK